MWIYLAMDSSVTFFPCYLYILPMHNEMEKNPLGNWVLKHVFGFFRTLEDHAGYVGRDSASNGRQQSHLNHITAPGKYLYTDQNSMETNKMPKPYLFLPHSYYYYHRIIEQ